MEVTHCVRRTCCYEYDVRRTQSGSVIPVSGTRRRTQARPRQSCRWAYLSLSLYLYSVLLSLSFSLSFFFSFSSSLFLSLRVVLALFSEHIRVSGEPVSAAFALCLLLLHVSRPQLSLREDVSPSEDRRSPLWCSVEDITLRWSEEQRKEMPLSVLVQLKKSNHSALVYSREKNRIE